jgi:protein-S-isoprenylcysteine O-methyltransferase Ste14
MIAALLNILGIAISWGIWLGLSTIQFSPAISAGIAVGGTLLVIPIVFIGRWLLDRQPTVSRALLMTTSIHYLLAILLGSAIIEATRFAQNWKLWPISVSPWTGFAIMILSCILLGLIIFNLALKGLGAPFAIALTRTVATDWIYAWTRNPMVLSGLAFLIGLGLWLQSSLFMLWLLIILSPAILIYLRVYEERELEIRFGEKYLAYKLKTPLIWPRKPSIS